MATPKNNSVIKAFQILNACSLSEVPLSTSEIAAAAGMTPATVHRFLITLEDVGAIARTDQNCFQLGFAIAEMARGIEKNDWLADFAEPHVIELVEEFQEAVGVAILNAGSVIYIATAEANRSLKIGHSTDTELPLYCSAVGKVLLAGLPTLEREELLHEIELVKYAPNTLSDLAALRQEIVNVAQKGYAVDDQELEEGLRCLAVPIFDGNDHVIAALSVSGPASRMTQDRMDSYLEKMQDRARQLGTLFYSESKVLPDKAPPLGSFPHIKRVSDFAFVSGISSRRSDETFVGARVKRNGEVELDIKEQTRATIENIRDVLRSVGSSLSDIIEIEAFLMTMDDYAGFNEVYSRFFATDGPARTTVAVNALPHPQQILMMKAVARVPQGTPKTSSL